MHLHEMHLQAFSFFTSTPEYVELIWHAKMAQ